MKDPDCCLCEAVLVVVTCRGKVDVDAVPVKELFGRRVVEF